MSNKSKISAAEKEICFGFIQSHLSAESSKSTRSSDSDSEPTTTDDAPCKGQGTFVYVYFSNIVFVPFLFNGHFIFSFTLSLSSRI
jgi:hypothetical protein